MTGEDPLAVTGDSIGSNMHLTHKDLPDLLRIPDYGISPEELEKVSLERGGSNGGEGAVGDWGAHPGASLVKQQHLV